MERTMMHVADATEKRESDGTKAYESPIIQELGDVTEITAFNVSVSAN